MGQKLFLAILGLLICNNVFATTYDLPDFIDANTGGKVIAVNIYGADAKAMFEFIKQQSPQMYSSFKSGNALFEHIRAKEIFCAKDTQRNSNGVVWKITYRCDFTMSGLGDLAPALTFIGSYGGPTSPGDNAP